MKKILLIFLLLALSLPCVFASDDDTSDEIAVVPSYRGISAIPITSFDKRLFRQGGTGVAGTT